MQKIGFYRYLTVLFLILLMMLGSANADLKGNQVATGEQTKETTATTKVVKTGDASTASVKKRETEVFTVSGTTIRTNLPKRATAWQISGPRSLQLQSTSAKVALDKKLPDGQYSFAIIGHLKDDEEQPWVKSPLNNGRGPTAKPTGSRIGVIQTGYFRIMNGSVLTNEEVEK